MSTELKQKKPRKSKTSVTTTRKEISEPKLFPPDGAKHIISCKCFLPQFKDLPSPPEHRFVVFSEFDEYQTVKASYAQCNNCGIIHKVIEIGKSIFIKKEDSTALESIDDITDQLPDWLKGLLQKYDCDLPTWQEARFIYHNQLWGRYVILVKEHMDDNIIGKALIILGERLHKVEAFERED